MNLPMLIDVLEGLGIKKPIICSSINKLGFRMPGGKKKYEKTIRDCKCRLMAMQVLACGAIPPEEAFKYVCKQKNIKSILFGASSKNHIQESKELIEKYTPKYSG